MDKKLPGNAPGNAENKVPGKPPGTTDAQVIDSLHVLQQPERAGEVAAIAAWHNVAIVRCTSEQLVANRVADDVAMKFTHATYAKNSAAGPDGLERDQESVVSSGPPDRDVA